MIASQLGHVEENLGNSKSYKHTLFLVTCPICCLYIAVNYCIFYLLFSFFQNLFLTYGNSKYKTINFKNTKWGSWVQTWLSVINIVTQKKLKYWLGYNSPYSLHAFLHIRGPDKLYIILIIWSKFVLFLSKFM